MTTRLHWFPILALATAVPGCIIPKSIGEDPDSMDSAADEGMDAAGSTTGGDTSAGSSAGSNSATSTGGGNSSAGSATATGGVDPVTCGVVDEVPPGLPGFEYSFGCEGGCEFQFTTPYPLESPEETGICLCEAADCGANNVGVGEGGMESGTSSYGGVCEVDIEENLGEGFFQVSCACEGCTLEFGNITQESATQFYENGDPCDCLCLEAGCGYGEGAGGEVGGGETDGGETDGGGTAGSGTSGAG